MNILREVRRINKRSMPVRIILILIFSVILITTTYAWFSTQKNVTLGGLEADVTAWDVAYYVNDGTDGILDKTVTITIDEFYPGMPEREDKVHIYNMGEIGTNIQYELISVKVFEQEVLSTLQLTGEITTDTTTNTTHLFSKDTAYPFNISYTYDKTYLEGNPDYVDFVTEGGGYETSIEKNGTTVTPPHATFRYLVSWDYDVDDGTATENSAKDVLDTKFGKDAYEFYQDNANDPTKAIEIQVRITSSMVETNL